MKQPIRVKSRANDILYADAIPGHFATNHSHINFYVDMSELKHNVAMAREAAKSFAYRFDSSEIDTILCIEGTEYIGAYLARELSISSLRNMNSGQAIYLVDPEYNINGQLMLSDDLRPMVKNKNVLVMVNTASTGQTLSQTRECVEYYGGRVAGYTALFSVIEKLDGLPVVSLFTKEDFPFYRSFTRGKSCPACAAKEPLDDIVTPKGYTKL